MTDVAGDTRVVVVGAGHVGAATAFALVRSGIASEVVLVDSDLARAQGEAMDIDHAVPFGRPVRVWAGTVEDCRGAAVIVVTAGAGQRPGQTRTDLAARNAAVFTGLIPGIAARAPEAVIVIATNPVDVMTMGAVTLAGLPRGRVFGSGTVLDTARLRFLLSRRFKVDARSVHAHVVGEHGDSEVVAWSSANIAGIPLDRVSPGVPFGEAERVATADETRRAAYAIIQAKGHTAFGIGAGLVRIVEAVLRDERSVLSVSSPVDGAFGIHNVCVSLPSVVGRGGVQRVLPLGLDEAEQAALRQSAGVVRATAVGVGFGVA
jgi:L-lactate dehydrogenase